MNWGERLTDDDEEGRIAALRALQERGPEAGAWLSSILDHLSGLEIESREWSATWRAAARVAATDGGARLIRQRLGGARHDVEIRALLMVVMNLPQELWPSGDALVRFASSGEPATRGIALQLAPLAQPPSRALAPIIDACSDADPALRMSGWRALLLLLAADAGLIGDRRVLEALGRAVVQGTEDIRLELVQRLASPPLSPGVEEILASALADPKSSVRAKAAQALLSSRRRDAAVRALVGLIASEDETELRRCEVIDDLPAEADQVPEIVAALRGALRARSAEVRASAELVLARVDEAR